jgi:ABC-type antimicrobial peptide transport system permease subunit
VLHDLLAVFPATLELATLALIVGAVLGSRPSQKMGTELPNRVKVRTAKSHGEPA